TPKERLGLAFGVHRALDTTGAMLGPLLAFGLLALRPGHFDVIFVISFCIALVGFAILTLFVKNQREAAPSSPDERVSLRPAARLLSRRRFGLLVVLGSLLSLVTISDGFVYLCLQRRVDFDFRFLPLLYVGTAIVYMVLAVPFGRLADRLGRGRVFVA